MKLAIKGHPTEGNKVIEILEMLGGTNVYHHRGGDSCIGYTVEENEIRNIHYILGDEDFIFFTLEEFLEKYPYKVGDKVLARGSAGKITYMRWQGDSFFTIEEGGEVVYTVMLDTEEEITFSVEDLQPYKEQETVENKLILNQSSSLDGKTFAGGYDQEYDDGQHDMIEWNLPEGFIFKDENGNVINANKIVLEKKKPKYPMTYEECCNTLEIKEYPTKLGKYDYGIISKYSELPHYIQIQRVFELLICRDAYWEIAGEQVGLGKPWEYDCTKGYYTPAIIYRGGFIQKVEINNRNAILAFPTVEMRNAFYENFKELIETCKELL